MRLHLPVAAVLAVLGAGWCAAADTSLSPSPSPSQMPDQGQAPETGAKDAAKLSDQSFVEQAAGAGTFEVKSSQLALSKGVDQQTRVVAQMMVDDHQKAGDELKGIAQRKGIAIKPDLPADLQAQLDKLQGYTGVEFAKQYVQVQIKAHQDAVALFQRAGRDLQDPELKQFAQKTLPTLQGHLAHVQGLSRDGRSSMNDGAQGGQRGSQGGSLGLDQAQGGWSSQTSVQDGTLGSAAQPAAGEQSPGSSAGMDGAGAGYGGSTTIDSGIGGAAAPSVQKLVVPGSPQSQPAQRQHVEVGEGRLTPGAEQAPPSTGTRGY